MNIRELLFESISLMKYQKPLRNAANSAVIEVIKSIGTSKHNFSYDDPISFVAKTVKNSHVNVFRKYLEHNLLSIISRVDPKGAIKSIKFRNIPTDDNANILNGDVEIHTKFLIQLYNQLFKSYYSLALVGNPSQDEIVDYFFDAAQDQEIQNEVLYDVQKYIDPIIEVLIHEWVHGIQDYQQPGRTSEYRSYLEDPKKQGELSTLLQKRYQSGNKLSSEESSRWDQLYRASPQEMAAMAHQMVFAIIKSAGLHQDINDPAALPKVKELGQKIPEYVSNYFGIPQTKIEQKVYNRYMKLVYLELDRWYDSIK